MQGDSANESIGTESAPGGSNGVADRLMRAWVALPAGTRWGVCWGIGIILTAYATVLRVYHLLQVPWAGDVVRHLRYAEAMLRHGPRVAGMTIEQIDPAWVETTVWPKLAYLYPPVTFLFFLPIAAVSPTVFAAKLVLTVIEGINAVLCWRITGERWIGVLYWACPVSIWEA